jgi:hypothetical protein
MIDCLAQGALLGHVFIAHGQVWVNVLAKNELPV